MKYWKRINGDGTTNTVESYSRDNDIEGAIEIEEAEYQSFIQTLPPPKPPRNLGDEIDDLRAEVEKLKKEK